MCGLAGIIGRDPSQLAPRLRAMTQGMHHRGPDDQGCLITPMGRVHLGFGHRRLSIIDLSPLGHQPMGLEADAIENGDALIYNGEIYNHKALRRELESLGIQFRGSSDTEVLLRGLWRFGPAFIDRLQGMFALAYFNRRDQTVLLARDPLGIKPLYVAAAPDAFIFASEVRTILASGLVERRLNRQALGSLLAYGAVQAPSTIVDGVGEFPAGHWQIISADVLDRGASAPTKHWDFQAPSLDISEDVAVSRIQGTLNDAVRDHLISDVPIGVFLSSGLDSTIIAALAAAHVDQLRTFTVGFAEHSDLSESQLARETAQLLGVQHTEINVTGPEAIRLTMDWLAHQDQPSLDGLNVFIISRMVRQAGVTVALSGQGGDEMFGGYASFHDVPLMHRWMNRFRWLPSAARLALARAAAIGKSEFMHDKFRDLAASHTDFLSLYLQRRRSLSDRHLARLGVEARALGLTSNFLLPQAEQQVRLEPRDAVWNVSLLESRFYMANMLLRDGDSNSMAHSLEVRVPFLDRRIIDLASRLPGSMRLPPGQPKKHLLRRAFPQFLRPALSAQGKRGFEIPVKRWMLGPLREVTQQSLAALKSSGCVNPQGVDDVWHAFQREPETPMWSRAWLLVSLGNYLQQHQLSTA